jgi:hypothetical protein
MCAEKPDLFWFRPFWRNALQILLVIPEAFPTEFSWKNLNRTAVIVEIKWNSVKQKSFKAFAKRV